MICERCGKEEASVHLTRIINGKKEEIHLCEKCAKTSSQFNKDENNLSFQSLLSGILNHNLSKQDSSIFNNKYNDLTCNNCGMTYHEFTQDGLFGCVECFGAFNEKLDSLFKRIHGNLLHAGKRPISFQQKLETESEINELKYEMQVAVDKENFEKAAEIRDKIHAIKENIEEESND